MRAKISFEREAKKTVDAPRSIKLYSDLPDSYYLGQVCFGHNNHIFIHAHDRIKVNMKIDGKWYVVEGNQLVRD